jgi:hypothetical protein
MEEHVSHAIVAEQQGRRAATCTYISTTMEGSLQRRWSTMGGFVKESSLRALLTLKPQT